MPVENDEENQQPQQAETTLQETSAPVKETSASKENESANNSYEDMESLLVNEDEDDDQLGTESLRMSGSEGEDGEKVSPKRRKKRAPKILDSDEENDDKQEAKETVEESETIDSELAHVAYKPKKFLALVDSDSEAEEIPDEIVSESHSRISKLIHSESDCEGTSEENAIKVARKKKAKRKSKKSVESKSRISKEPDSDPDTDEESSQHGKVSNIIDSESESSGSDSANEKETRSQEHEEESSTAQPQKKKQRASAKKAIDEMQAIQSETQRLYRETQVSIPYHKPKRHTLKEFLTRRTIEKPKVGEVGSGKKLKMSAEELVAYVKHLEERAKEATEFFKSESEDELVDNTNEDGENQKQPEVSVPADVLETPTAESMEVETPSETQRAMESEELGTFLDQETPSQPTTQELLDIDMPQESILASEPIASTSSAVLDKPLPSTSKSLSDLKRRLIAENNLPANPTLKGDPNMIIDFETGDMLLPKPTGLESLFQRFVKSNAHKKKKPKEGLSVLTVENGKIDVSVIEEPNKEKEPKPGAAYVKLKESLRSLITKKRKEDFKKKIEETQEEEEEYNKCCGFDEEEEEEDNKSERRSKAIERDIVIDDEENEIELEDADDNDEEAGDNDEELEVTANDDDKADEVDGNDDDENEEEDENDSDSDEEEEEEENEDKSTRKHRVIKAFEDSDNENDDVDTGLNTTSTSVLFAEEAEKNPEEVENELLGLCSGQFEESQRAPLISQIPITQTPGNVHDTELMDLCSGVFNEEPAKQANADPEKTQRTVTKILSSDEENEQEKDESNSDVKKVKKLKKKKKKRAKLSFSDDEDEDEESVQEDLHDSFEENKDEMPQTFIDYDSEENEVEVQMSKKECLKEANSFFEKEAELSESEWGSADEDEENLDKYDVELGDEDEFDRDKIHEELEQIHMRKVLDDDIREVKKIQDMLFDNEEIDGVGRQRQFRWKNIESGFSLEDPAGDGDDNNEEVDSADDEEEMKWRKMRFEREQLLMQKTKEEILAEVSATTLGRTLLSTMKPDIKSDPVYTKEVLVAKEYKAPSFLIAQCDVKAMRGSFLNYDKETLARIAATVTKSGLPNEDEQIQHKASKTGNFVFAPLSEEEQMLRKRKAEELQNAKSGNNAKKQKANPQSSKSLLLDKLL